MSMRPINRIELMMFGPTNLSKPININRLLDALECERIFTPEFANDDERRSKTYDREWCIDVSTNPVLRYAGEIYLKRKKAAKYNGYFSYSARPFVHITFEPKLSKKNYLPLLAWSQALVDAFIPDYASLSFRQMYEENPWPTKLDEALNKFSYSSRSYNGLYYNTGPTGIGMFNWFSEYIVNLIDTEHLSRTPNLKIEKQSWGGYYLTLDLEKRPWETEPQLLVDTWKPAMDHLSETGAFVQQYVEKGNLRMRKGNSQIPPREVENWSN